MKNFFKLVVIVQTIFIISCSDESTSPEDEIKQYIETAKIAVESRSHSDLADLVHIQYHDHNNHDIKKLTAIARAYFFTHKNIHLLTKIDSINFQNENTAFVVLYVAMAGNVITDLNALTSLRARVYKFELQLIKNEIWLLQQARWTPADIKDML